MAVRAISTVLDVAVFSLLVAAAVGTLVVAEPPTETETSADETAEVVASSTAAVEYELDGKRRQAHGTIGTLLARGAVAGATLDGQPLSSASEAFRGTVRSETRARLGSANRTQVVARWMPYRDAPMQGRVVVGSEPPPGVDVHTATLTVPAPVDRIPANTRDSPEGYESVARAVAAAVADGLLPATPVDASVYRPSPATAATESRYRTVSERTEVDAVAPLDSGAVETAHERATDGLARRFEKDMRRRFDSPAAAAHAIRTGEVRIVVRRWDA